MIYHLSIECIGESGLGGKDAAMAALFFGKQPSRAWVAKVKYMRGNYVDREFIQGKKDYSSSNGAGSRGIYKHYFLEDGLYEISAPQSWKSTDRYFAYIEDGYTQPIVTFGTNGHYEVIDGFHRNRVGRECKDIQERIKGYLPVAIINPDREDKADRMAATIRHNRARGKHSVDGMSALVQDLTRRNWSEEKIAKEIGMEPDEVLRLKQITGLAEMFADREFSEAWEV